MSGQGPYVGNIESLIWGLSAESQDFNILLRLEEYNNLILFLTAILEFVVVVTFPVKFGQDIIMVEAVRRWEFDWAYGFAWGGLVFSVGAAIFFLLPNKYMYTRTKTSQNNNYSMAATEPDM